MRRALVIRTDLGMGKGKMVAQAAHTSLLSAEQCRIKKPGWYSEWNSGLYKKIVLKVGTQEALEDLYRKATELGFPAAMVKDAGLTQLDAGALTCLGIGSAPEDELNNIIAALKLL